MTSSLILLLLAWVLFFVLHSALADLRVKALIARRWPTQARYHRALYNLFAMISILPALLLTWQLDSPVVWEWGSWKWLSVAITVSCLVGFYVSSRGYDFRVFLGLVPDQSNHIGHPDEPFSISFFHRYVRHPWYFFGIVMIWVQTMTPGWLMTCCLATAYFVYGARLEERKLVTWYGDRYRAYQQRVPALFPLPGRHLSANEADTLRR